MMDNMGGMMFKAVQRWQPAWTESDLQQCVTKVR